jgi:hypothetical protein
MQGEVEHNAARDIVRQGTKGRKGDTRASNDANKREQLENMFKNGPTRTIPVIEQPRSRLTSITEA